MQTPEDNFYCPITFGMMIDPVIGPDGHTYERTAIESWLQVNNKSPLTKQIMSSTELIPNIALRNTIQQFLLNNPSMKSHKKNQVIVNSNICRNININAKVLSNNQLYVKLIANEEAKRKPSVFIFIIDVSGSMDTEASVSNGSGESDGFSRLDLVKHSVRTVIEVLEPQDSIMLITFSNDAKVKLDLTPMTDQGKDIAIQTLSNISTEGMTNIWDGLRVGLLNVQKISDPNVNISMMLLTDGEPNQNPPKGIVPTLKSAMETMKLTQSFTINTFGFGYALDSELLNDISTCGSGIYGYIPDCSMVGTIFVNYLSNVLSTYLSNSNIYIKSGDSLLSTIQVGSIQFEQPKELIVDISNKQLSDLNIELVVGDKIINKSYVDNHIVSVDSETICATFRNLIINTLYKSIHKCAQTGNFVEVNQELRDLYDNLYGQYSTLMLTDQDRNILSGYYQDWESSDQYKGGQIKQAFSKAEWFNKWGKHFLLSIVNAYNSQQCNNFKDPGVQNYGGRLFKQIRDAADAAFCMLPAPKPNYRRYGSSVPTNMSSYYNAAGSCYDGNGLVDTDNGLRPVYSLRKGDIVKSMDSNGNIIFSQIKCVVKSRVHTEYIDMCRINGFFITPWHPIMNSDGSWIFPINITNEIQVELSWIYNIVLDDGCCVFINNTPVITLGHNLDHPIAAHPYYGTQAIVNDLETMPGWNQGCVILNRPSIMRENGLVTKLINNN